MGVFSAAERENCVDKKGEREYNVDKARQGKAYINMEEKRIYFDHAATTPLDEEVLNKMLPYFTECFGNADSPHAVGRKAMQAVDQARDGVSAALGAKSSELYFTSGGTESDNWAMRCGAYAQKSLGRTHVILSAIEHHATLAAAERLKSEGFTVSYLPVNKNGVVDVDCLEALVTEKTGLVAVMAANNETGVLQPIEKIGEIAHEKGALFFTDAVQVAPYMPIDVKKWGADILSLSAHKFYGPKGVGALYIKSGIKTEKLIVGGEQERGLRGGTTNVVGVVGLAAAYLKNAATMSASNEKIAALRALFLKEISSLEKTYINGKGAESLPSVLNVRFEGVENVAFLYGMDLKGVSLAAGSACASASVKPSHVLTAMGLTEEQAKNSVRFSFGKNNTEEEVLKGAALTMETVKRLRGDL